MMNFEIFIFCILSIVGRFSFLVWPNAVSWSILRIENISIKKINISFYPSNFQKLQNNTYDLLVKCFKCNNYETSKIFKAF